MKTLTVTLLVLYIQGCASFTPDGGQRAGAGQATYHYKKSADGACEVVITSAREVPGLEAKINKDCAVTVKADALSGIEAQMGMIDALNKTLELLPGH